MAAVKKPANVQNQIVAPTREPYDVSPKVIIPVLGQLGVAVALLIVTGDSTSVIPAVTAVLTAVLGYQTPDPVTINQA